MKLNCPNCQTVLDVPQYAAKDKLKCGICGQHIVIEADAPASPQPTAETPSPAPTPSPTLPRPRRSLTKPLLFIGAGVVVVLIATVGAWFLNTKLPEIRFNYARHAARDAEAREQWDDALAAYETAAAIRPHDADTKKSLERVVAKKAEQGFRRSMTEGQSAETARDWRSALAHYEKALEWIRDEPSAQAARLRMHYNIEIESAQAAEQNKQWTRAAESYQRALLLKPADPTSTEALTRIAYLAAIEAGAQAEQQQQWEAATQAYRDALRHRPNDPGATQAIERLIEAQRQRLYDAALRHATQAEQTRQWTAAERAFQEALQYKPHDPVATEALRRIADTQREERYQAAFTKAADAERRRDWRVAEQFYREALNHKPNDPQAAEALQRIAYTAVIELAQALESRREWQQATQAYNDALRIKPNDPLAHQGLRRVAESDAAARYDAAMQAGAQAEQRKDWDNAANAYRAALQVRPNDAQASEGLRRLDYFRHLERAQHCEQQRDWNGAIGFYRQALRFRPDDPLCLEGMHRIQEFVAAEQFNSLMLQAAEAQRRRDWNGAAHFYNEALRIRPGHPAAEQALRRLDELVAQESFNAAMRRGAECEQRHQWRDALNCYRDAQRLRPNDFGCADAIRRCEEQIQLEPYNEALKRASQAETNRRWREAADQYQRALNVKPADATATQGFQRAMYSDAMERGQQFEQRKDWAMAVQAYSEAITHRPGDPVATEALRRATENMSKPKSQAPPPLAPPSNASALNAYPPNAPPHRTPPQNPTRTPLQNPASNSPPNNPPKAAPVPDDPTPPPPPVTPAQKAAYDDAFSDALAAEKKGKWLDAIAHYERALEAVPDDLTAIRSIRYAKFNDAMTRGNNALRVGNRDEAAAAFREAYQLIPEDKAPTEALRRMGLRPD